MNYDEIDIYEYGHLEGKIWVFNEVQLVNGNKIKKIDFSQMIYPEDVSFEKIVKETVVSFMDPETQYSGYDGYMKFPSQN